METVEYAAGRLADVFDSPRNGPFCCGTASSPTRAPRSARSLSCWPAHGLGVVVPDWDSHADDGGRADLLRSVHFARERVDDPDGLVLVGWSMGGVAAAGLTIAGAPARYGFRAHRLPCRRVHGGRSDLRPRPGNPAARWRTRAPRSPSCTALADHVIPVSVAIDFASALRQHDWPVKVVELPADHGSIAGAIYDAVAGRYSAADDAETLAVAADVAARIATPADPSGDCASQSRSFA